jgi:hypothetical protein
VYLHGPEEVVNTVSFCLLDSKQHQVFSSIPSWLASLRHDSAISAELPGSQSSGSQGGEGRIG